MAKKRSKKTEGKYEYKLINGNHWLKGSSPREGGVMLKKGARIFSDDPDLHKKLPNKYRAIGREDEQDEEMEEIEDNDFMGSTSQAKGRNRRRREEEDDEEEEEEEKPKKSKKDKEKKSKKDKPKKKRKKDEDDED